MEERTIYLLNENHIGHPMHFLLSPRESSEYLQETPDGGVLLPKGSTLVKLECILCGCTLEEGVDYQFGRPEADGSGSEDWYHEHKRLYPESCDDDWLCKHRRLYDS